MNDTGSVYDLCIIGGGIHGAGIARDAAGRGLRVILLEKNDLASATSSASSKMLHGGLRYLEYFEFRLVREALKEREILLKIAPHVIRPMDFILPHVKSLRPAWLIRVGLFLYDHLSGRQKLKASHFVDLEKDPAGAALKNNYRKGFRYADGWMDDSRLVVLNAMDAAEHGAVIKTRARCEKISAAHRGWTIEYVDRGESREISAKMIVNAGGPWVRDIARMAGAADKDTPGIRLVKGSHIVVPRLYEGDQAYVLQQPDRRVVFAWPYGPHYNYIGTTDVDYDDDPGSIAMSDAEAIYLCDAANLFFTRKITQDDIVASWSGVRTLIADEHEKASAVARDYKLVASERNGAKMISVFGGKMTTYRKLSEKVVDGLTDVPAWTSMRPLPGGAIEDIARFTAQKQAQYNFLPADLVSRYVSTYGTLMDSFVGTDMGLHFGDDVYEAEIRYLILHEFAKTSEDVLWRRTKLGLRIADETLRNIDEFLTRYFNSDRQEDHDRARPSGH